MTTERNSDKTFLFHIGLPKTGSTSIQGALVTFSEQLEQRGVYFPYDKALYGTTFPNRAAPIGAPQNEGFNHFFDTPPKRAPGPIDWAKSIDKFMASDTARYYVFIHENMSTNAARLRPEIFQDLARRGNLEFSVYLRHPLSYLDSFCLQNITGRGAALSRANQTAVRIYLKQGFHGLLEPFRALGKVHVRDFDVARQNNNLVADAFSIFGAESVLSENMGAKVLNTSKRRLGMATILLAMKATSQWSQAEWLDVRSKIVNASEALEPSMDTSLLSQELGDKIMARWRKDRRALAETYGIQMNAHYPFTPGPDQLVFSQEYGDQLRALAKPNLTPDQDKKLKAAIVLAGQDVEAYIAQNAEGYKPIRDSF